MDMQYNMNPQQMIMPQQGIHGGQQMQMNQMNQMNMNQMQTNPMQMNQMQNNPMQNNPMQNNPMQMGQIPTQITGPIGGTSIADLNIQQQPSKREIKNNNQVNNIFQQKKQKKREIESDINDMEGLVKDINRDLDNFSGSKAKSSDSSDTESEKKPIKKRWFYIPNIVKESLLLTFVYLLMSQSFIKKAIAMHITYLNPTEEGNISIIGIAIYGLILSIIYMIFKKLLIN
jgi:hypothetical protein